MYDPYEDCTTGKKISKAISNQYINESVSEKAIVTMSNLLGDSVDCVIQDFDTAKEVWDTLKSRNVGPTMINEISIFSTLLNMTLRAGGKKRDHVPPTESQISRSTSMGSEIDDSMKIAITIQFFSNLKEYASTITSITEMEGRLATWNHVRMLLL